MPVDDSRWRYRRSLASRVILLTTVAVGVAVAFVAAGAYVTARMQLQSSLDESLLERAHGAAKYQTLLQANVPPSLLGAADVRIAYVTASGRAFSIDRLQPRLPLGAPEVEVAAGRSESSVRTLRVGSDDYRVVAVPATAVGDTSLVIAQSLAQQQSVLARLGIVMLGFGAVGVVVAGFAGWLVARNGLRPVRRLTTAVEGKARTEDLRPLPVEGDDEVARLAHAFNEMLIALDASRERQRALVADAGHELRTPLTSLRTNIDLLTQSDDPRGPTLEPGSRTEVLDDIRAQIDELTNLIGDLTELARADPASSVVEEVDLSEIVDQALNRVRLRAPGLGFDVVHPAVVGDRRRRRPRACDHQPARQRGQVEPTARAGQLPVDRRCADRRGRRAGHRRGRPSACLRSLLARQGVADHARLGPRPFHRASGRRSPLLQGRGRLLGQRWRAADPDHPG